MKQIMTRLYPFCVFAVVLVVADTHWPETVDALSVAQHRQALGAQVPNPARLGNPNEYASLAVEMCKNGYFNGEDVRLDGAIRMAPR